MKYNVPIHVRTSFSEEEGTMVVNDDVNMEQLIVSGVTHNKNQARITLRKVPDRPGIASKILSPIAEAGLIVDMIIQNTRQGNMTDLTFTVEKKDFKPALEIAKKTGNEINAEEVVGDENIAKVSVTGVGMRSHYGVAAKMFETLAAENINIMMISTSEIRISCIIEEKYTELAVQALHTAFGLDKTE
jgi:aspartate kinase